MVCVPLFQFSFLEIRSVVAVFKMINKIFLKKSKQTNNELFHSRKENGMKTSDRTYRRKHELDIAVGEQRDIGGRDVHEDRDHVELKHRVEISKIRSFSVH